MTKTMDDNILRFLRCQPEFEYCEQQQEIFTKKECESFLIVSEKFAHPSRSNSRNSHCETYFKNIIFWGEYNGE